MTGTRFLRHIFRPCRRTRRPSKENSYENYFNRCSLSAGADLYGLWVEWISQLYPPATPGESIGNAVLCCRQRIALCRVLFRRAGSWRTAAALRPFRASGTDTSGCGALQHPRVPSDDGTGDHCSWSGGLCTVVTGLPSVSRKLHGHLHRKACDAGMNCVAAIAGCPTLGFLSALPRLRAGQTGRSRAFANWNLGYVPSVPRFLSTFPMTGSRASSFVDGGGEGIGATCR